jgi:uncharacterized protein YaaQ
MKLILAIVVAEAVDTVSKALVTAGYSMTHISSVGGFLRRGSTTLVIGVEESKVDGVLETLRKAAPTTPRPDKSHSVTVFVLNAGVFLQV